MKAITRDEFEDILFDEKLSIVQKRRSERGCSIRGKKNVIVELVCDGHVLATRTTTPQGTSYFKAEA